MKQIKVVDANINLLSVRKIIEKAETQSIGFFLFDLENNILEFTKQLSIFYPIPCKEYMDIDQLLENIAKEDCVKVKKVFTNLLCKDSPNEQVEYRVLRKGKMPEWLRCTIHKIQMDELPTYLLGVVEDITNATNHRMMVESCLDGTFIGDLQNNKAVFDGKIFEELWMESGYHEEAVGEYNSIIIEEDVEIHDKYIEHLCKNRVEKNRLEYRVYDKKHNPMWISNRNKMIYSAEGDPVMIVGGYININELKSYNRYVEATTETCDITGLYNRCRFLKEMKRKLSDEENNGYIIYVSIDGFKNISNAFDFKIGNTFLREVGKVLAKNKNNGDFLFHVNPGHFVLDMSHAGEKQALEKMKEFEMATLEPFVTGNIHFPYSISMAAVQYDDQSMAAEDILKKCAIVLRKIELERKNKYLVFKEDIVNEYDERMNFEICLYENVLQNMSNFFLVYQPFIEAKTNSCVGVEALLRWKNKNGEIISPSVFIPILEDMGVMDTVGEWVFKAAAEQGKKWLEMGFGENFYVSVNATATQVQNDSFASMILSYLKEISLPSRNIIIEITESTLILDLQRGMTQLDILKKNGVRLALDDFGTGYSSLSYLKNLPMDKIKIDRSFIQDIETDDYSREFVSSIIKITQSIGKIICLEGVETEQQMELLKKMDADIFQGYLFGKPQDPVSLEKLFKYYRDNVIDERIQVG